jgi:hypothetical protein
MTKAYLVLKYLDGISHPIVAKVGEQLILSEESATELDMVSLELAGYVKSMTDAEALKHHLGE